MMLRKLINHTEMLKIRNQYSSSWDKDYYNENSIPLPEWSKAQNINYFVTVLLNDVHMDMWIWIYPHRLRCGTLQLQVRISQI